MHASMCITHVRVACNAFQMEAITSEREEESFSYIGSEAEVERKQGERCRSSQQYSKEQYQSLEKIAYALNEKMDQHEGYVMSMTMTKVIRRLA